MRALSTASYYLS